MTRRIAATQLFSVCACILAGCAMLKAPVTTPVPLATPINSNVDTYLTLLAALSDTNPAHQSDLMFDVEKSYTQAPTTVNALRYAIALAVPGHLGSNAGQAKKLLAQLLATPERISSAERSIAVTMLNVSDEWTKLQADNRRLAATVDDRIRVQANSERRVLTQAEEIAKLHKALDAAQIKLDAIRDIERSISERSAPSPGSRDPNNRDPSSQTQTPPAGR